MKRRCVGQTFIVYCRKATTLQQKSNLLKLFSTGVKEKKKLMNFSCFKTLFFISFLITYNSITN